MVINVNTLIRMPISKVVKLKRNVSLRFDDNVVIEDCYYKSVIVFRLLLELRNEIEFEVNSELWIHEFYENGFYNSNVHTDMYSKILKSIVVPYIAKHGNNDILHKLFKAMFVTIDFCNKDMVRLTLEYTPSLDVMDLLYIQFDKDIIDELIAVVKDPTPHRIKESYSKVGEVLKKPIHSGNVMVLLYLAKISSAGQIHQLLMSRGYITELNNKIFKYPLTNSFLLGFKGPYDFLIESRAGIKALALSSTTIQKAEYTHREVATVTSPIERVVHKDCGSKRYTNFFVNDDIYEGGILIKKQPLASIAGKYYLDTDNVLKVVSKNDTHLIGKTIRMRQAFNCITPNKKEICSHCLGTIGDTITSDRNLGNIIMATLLVIMAQGLLSAKHLLNNALSIAIKLDNKAKKFFMVRNGEEVFFKANVVNKKTKDVYVRIKQSEAWGISNIADIQDIFSININRVSRIQDMTLMTVDNNGNEEYFDIPLQSGGNRAFLTIQFLQYIAKVGYETHQDDFFIIKVNDFNTKLPILKFDKVEYSLATLNAEFKKHIKTQKFVMVDGVVRSEITPEVLAQQLFDLINSKLSVNIAIIETIVYALTAKDINKGNFDLGRGAKDDNVIGFGEAINSRSMGTGMSWDNLAGKIFDPRNYDDTSAVDTRMDVILSPAEVIRALGRS